MKFQLISLGGVKFDDEAYEVLIPTNDGDIAVLTNHEPLISSLRPGVIKIRRKASDKDDVREVFASYGGVLEVKEGGFVRVLVDAADNSEDINAAEAQKALEAAEKMKVDAKDKVALDHAQALIDRHTVRLNVAGLKRRHKG